MMKKEFRIPVEYMMYGYVEIEASSLEEALLIAHKDIDELPLPANAEYIDGSYKINDEEMDIIEYMNK